MMRTVNIPTYAGTANENGFVINVHDALVATMTIEIAGNAKIDTFFETVETAIDEHVGLGKEAVVADMLRRRSHEKRTYLVDAEVIIRQPMSRDNIDFFRTHSYPIYMGLDDVFDDPLPTMAEMFGQKNIAFISQVSRDRKT